ncbi:hypothetical protein N1851_019192 [Merluccius polli]|uniref:Uncharacterized protein n=1 Tax=Merluccius polli TaxID=89951 RepID=A0AA47NXV3_MERPO|nr:hypothetical protein N1851_019192 [Merluccius polli]
MTGCTAAGYTAFTISMCPKFVRGLSVTLCLVLLTTGTGIVVHFLFLLAVVATSGLYGWLLGYCGSLDSNPLHFPEAGVLLHGLVLLGFSVLTLVVLLRLIGWWRTRGNKTATEESIHTVGKDLGRAPRGPSVVQCGEQRPVGSAQDQVDPGEFSDKATYENMRAPPGCVGDTKDTGVHFVTVHRQNAKRLKTT